MVINSETVKSYLERVKLSPNEIESPSIELVEVAFDCLKDFVKYNWHCNRCKNVLISNEIYKTIEENSGNVIDKLSPNEKYIPALNQLKHVHLLAFAVGVILNDKFSQSNEFFIWRLRTLFVKQIIVSDPSQEIYDEILKEVERIENCEDIKGLEKQMILIEICQIFLWYREISKSKIYLDKALQLSGIEFNFEGRLGKRTKFQSDSKPQLSLVIKRKYGIVEDQNQTESKKSTKSPLNVPLDDDTLLSDVIFDNGDINENEENLSELEQSLMCATILQHFKGSAYEDILKREQTIAYLRYLIEKSTIWSVRHKCLYLRSYLEKDERRRMERSIKQLEELVKSVDTCDSCDERKFFTILVEPVWMVEKNLADSLFEIGCTKSSLDIYEKLQLWENMVDCYKRLDRKNKAELLIREQLEKGKTPYLLCLLGDVTDNIENYYEAWELSNHRSHRSQKSLGDHFFFRKEYSECIPFYVESLKINSMQHSSWSRLAFAALTIEDFEQAVQAYRRVVDFDHDCYEAWNNLSKAYIKLGDTQRAFKTLQEALKCNFEEWRIWENFLLVAFKVAAFDEVLNAWHRLIDLKGKHSDDQILEIFVKYIVNEREQFSEKLLAKVQKLFGRISATSHGSELFFRLYAEVLIETNSTWEKISDKLKSSYQSLINKAPMKSASDILSFTESCLQIIDVYRRAEKVQRTEEEGRSFLNSIKLSFKSAISLIKKKEDYFINDEENCKKIQLNIETIRNFIETN